MLDRLISGAGAVTDAADRSVRSIASGSRRDVGATTPGSLLVAAALTALAVLLVVAGIEATDPSVPVRLAARDVAAGRTLADRTYATISGALDTIYVETYLDDNGNDTEDPGENHVAWFYWLVDSTDRTGVTVRSSRSPAEVLTWSGRGISRTDPGYLTEDYPAFQDELDSSGITLAPGALIDATAGAAGPVTTVDPGGPIPTTGRPVSVSGSRLSEYLGVCTVDTNHDGECDELEQDAFEIIVFDPVSKHGVRVLVRDPPEFVDVTMTGLLRREERTVDDAQSVDGFSFGDLGLQVSDRYVLDEPAGASAAPLAFVLAAVLFAVAGAIVIGLLGGYLVYRGSTAALPAPTTSLAPGERVPLRITGLVETPTGWLHVREVPGELARVVLGPAAPDGTEAPDPPETPEAIDADDLTGTPPDAQPATTLVVEGTDDRHGVELGRGGLSELSSGRVMALRGPRPAIRAVAGSGPLLLSFETDAERDRAVAEMLGEAGLGPDGHPRATS